MFTAFYSRERIDDQSLEYCKNKMFVKQRQFTVNLDMATDNIFLLLEAQLSFVNS